MSSLEAITSIILLGVLILGFDIRREMRAKNRFQANKASNSEDERIANTARDSVNAPNKPTEQTLNVKD